jgi:hypothetical protein
VRWCVRRRSGSLIRGLVGACRSTIPRSFTADRQPVSTAIANAQAYDDERRRAETLAALDREKTAFFNVSHEFRRLR